MGFIFDVICNNQGQRIPGGKLPKYTYTLIHFITLYTNINTVAPSPNLATKFFLDFFQKIVQATNYSSKNYSSKNQEDSEFKQSRSSENHKLRYNRPL